MNIRALRIFQRTSSLGDELVGNYGLKQIVITPEIFAKILELFKKSKKNLSQNGSC